MVLIFIILNNLKAHIKTDIKRSISSIHRWEYQNKIYAIIIGINQKENEVLCFLDLSFIKNRPFSSDVIFRKLFFN